MTDPSDAQDGLTAGIFADVEYSPVQASPKKFKPWHQPRKQFVRRKQLCELLGRLYETRQTTDPLRYLGLPGTDLIDLRYLHEKLCRAGGRPLRFLGFNKEAQPNSPAHVELSLSLDEVRRLPNVDPASVVMHDDFRRISNPDSVAWARVERLGPFDVVNIDLCDGLASDPPHIDGSIYEALARLMTFQVRNPTPWLLLIATRIGQGMFDAKAEERLIDLFRKNVAKCDGFAEACEEILDSDLATIDPATCSQGDLLHVMTAAIGKWLSSLIQVQAPSRVEFASAHGYRTNPSAACEDLVSLALRVEPSFETSPDPFAPTRPVSVDECKVAKAILRRSAKRLDVDNILATSPELYEALIGETEQLLKVARYEVKDYRAWLVLNRQGA